MTDNRKLSLMAIQFFGVTLLSVSMLILTGCQSIQTAARKGDIKAVQQQLSWGINANSRNFFTRDTALIESAYNGHLEVVKLLLENGADVNLQGEAWYGPLHVASQAGYVDIVKILLENGANVNKYGGHNKPLNHAAMNGHIDVAKILLAHGADINAEGVDGWTALGTAISNDQLEMVKFLLSESADVNAMASYGCTPLQMAAWGENIEIGRVLLEHGAGPELECNGRKIPEDFLMKIRK